MGTKQPRHRIIVNFHHGEAPYRDMLARCIARPQQTAGSFVCFVLINSFGTVPVDAA